MFFAPSKSRERAKVWFVGISKTTDHIQIKIKMPNPSQEPPASSIAPNEDLKDMDVSDHIQIKIKMPNPSQESQASSKAPNEDLKDMDVLCTFKIKIESQNLDHGYIKDHWLYPNLDQDSQP